VPLDGARTGAPDAVQLADRFHLWQNLARGPRNASRPTVPAWPSRPPSPAAQDLPEPERTGQPDPAGRYAERTRRHHALVHGLGAEGRSLREIARHLGWGLYTVQRLDRAATWQELADGRWKAPRPSKLDPFKPYLDQHAMITGLTGAQAPGSRLALGPGMPVRQVPRNTGHPPTAHGHDT
jgi:hypothetical protein